MSCVVGKQTQGRGGEMPTMLFVDEDQILTKVTEKSLRRGKAYYESEMVESVIQRGSRLFAEVLGNDEDLYYVGIALQEDDFDASCTCPYDWGGYCKHIVAALLTWIHDREAVSQRTPIEDLLASLDADGLRVLVFKMIESNPELSETVGVFCHQGATVI